MDIKNMANTLLKGVSKHSPTILTVCSIVGVITTVGMAINATPKALQLIEDEELRREADYEDEEDAINPKPMTKFEIVKVAWTPYIPTIIMAGGTIACIISANTINTKRNAALASAYFLSENALKEYQAKVIEKIGEKKEKLLKQEIAQDHVKKTKNENNTIVVSGGNDTLCLDLISGRYIRTSVDKLRRAENEINKQLLNDMWMSLNEMYYKLGVDSIAAGNELGWDINKDGLLNLEISTCLTDDDEPCLTFNFNATPRPKYAY